MADAGAAIRWDSVADMAIMTRTLGRTGADVTILSYGAMELRGQPRGPEIADPEAAACSMRSSTAAST
jgi:hypothetical protein